MRKYYLKAVLMLLLATTMYSQDYRIGIKIAPTISGIRVAENGASENISKGDSYVKLMLGAFVDIPFKENYYFHLGLNYASRSTEIRLNPPGLTTKADHEHLQVPLLLKLYTNEVTLDTKLFFNFGIVPELRLTSHDENVLGLLDIDYKALDVLGNFGGGVERSIGVNTRVFASLNYYIGFLNSAVVQEVNTNESKLKSNLLSLEFGVKF